MEKEHDIIVEREAKHQRLDIFLSGKTGLSRSQVHRLIISGNVILNHANAKPSYHLKENDRIIMRVPEPKTLKAKPEKMELDVVYEDKDIIVINKPRGVVVHPAAGHEEGTLVNALLFHCRDLSGVGGAIRPGVVHRLDKDTSGLIVFAKNDEAHLNLSRQMKDRQIKKIYLAIVHGSVKKDSGEILEPIGRHPFLRKKMSVIRSGKLKSRDAITQYRVLKRSAKYSYLEVTLKTGRTHQIRVHLSFIGHPVVGDKVYSRKKNEFGVDQQLLHAYVLGFNHPKTGRYMEFKANMPEDMERVLSLI